MSSDSPRSEHRRTRKKARATFLEAVTLGLTVVQACQEAGVGRTTVYDWRDSDPEFAAAWDVAYDRGTDALEAEAQRRAFDGVVKPVTVAGEREEVREYSDTLLIFLMKGRKPQRFRDNHKVELTGEVGPVKVEHEHRLTLDDLAAYVAGQGKPIDPA